MSADYSSATRYSQAAVKSWSSHPSQHRRRLLEDRELRTEPHDLAAL